MDKYCCESFDDLIEKLAFWATEDDVLEYKADVLSLRIGVVIVDKVWLTLRLSMFSDPRGQALLNVLTKSKPAFLRKLQEMVRRRRLRRKLEKERG